MKQLSKMAFCKKQSCFLSVLINFLKLMTGIMMYMLITVRRRFKTVLSARVADMGKPIEEEFFLVEKEKDFFRADFKGF